MAGSIATLDLDRLTMVYPLAGKLAHDVGKYIARMARNLPAGNIPETLCPLVCADLYALDGARPASAVFDDLAAPLGSIIEDDRLDRCREALREIDRLEDAVRSADETALRRAAELAMQVETELLSLHRDVGEALARAE